MKWWAEIVFIVILSFVCAVSHASTEERGQNPSMPLTTKLSHMADGVSKACGPSSIAWAVATDATKDVLLPYFCPVTTCTIGAAICCSGTSQCLACTQEKSNWGKLASITKVADPLTGTTSSTSILGLALLPTNSALGITVLGTSISKGILGICCSATSACATHCDPHKTIVDRVTSLKSLGGAFGNAAIGTAIGGAGILTVNAPTGIVFMGVAGAYTGFSLLANTPSTYHLFCQSSGDVNTSAESVVSEDVTDRTDVSDRTDTRLIQWAHHMPAQFNLVGLPFNLNPDQVVIHQGGRTHIIPMQAPFSVVVPGPLRYRGSGDI